MGKGDRRGKNRRRSKKGKKKHSSTPRVASTGSPDTTLGARGLNALTPETMTVDEGGVVLEFFPAPEPEPEPETEPEEELHAQLAALREELAQKEQVITSLQEGAQVERVNTRREIETLEEANRQLLGANTNLFAERQRLESEVARKGRENATLQEANNELAAAKSQAERTAREANRAVTDANRAASDAKGEAAREKAAAAAADARIADLEATHATEIEALQAQLAASLSSNFEDRVLSRFHTLVTGEVQLASDRWRGVCARAATFLRRTETLVNEVEDARFQAEQAVEEVEDAAGEKVWDRSYGNFNDWVEKANAARRKREALQAFAPAVDRASRKRDEIDAESQELQQRAKSLKAQLTRIARVFMDAGIDLWQHFDVPQSRLELLDLSMGDSADTLTIADLHKHDLSNPDFTDAEWLRRYDKAVEPIASPEPPKAQRKSRRKRATTPETAAPQNVVLMPGHVFTDAPELELERLVIIALFVVTKGGAGGREVDFAPVMRTLTESKLLREHDRLARDIDRCLKRWRNQGKISARVDHSGPLAVRYYSPNGMTSSKVDELLEKVTSGAGKSLVSRLSGVFYRR